MFLAKERTGRQSGTNNPEDPRRLGGGTADIHSAIRHCGFRAAVGGGRAILLASYSALPYCVRHGSTAKHSRVRTPLRLRTIPGLGNRGSSAMYRAALRELPLATFSAYRARDKHHQPVAGWTVDVARRDALGGANGMGSVAGCGAGMYSDAREDLSAAVVAAL